MRRPLPSLALVAGVFARFASPDILQAQSAVDAFSLNPDGSLDVVDSARSRVARDELDLEHRVWTLSDLEVTTEPWW